MVLGVASTGGASGEQVGTSLHAGSRAGGWKAALRPWIRSARTDSECARHVKYKRCSRGHPENPEPCFFSLHRAHATLAANCSGSTEAQDTEQTPAVTKRVDVDDALQPAWC